MDVTTETTQQPSIHNGAFGLSLKRNNKQIREDRANAIVEDAEISFRRILEDDCQKYRRLKVDRENMLDLSPENSTALKLASDFDAQAWSTKDVEISVNMRALAIKINVAAERYKTLFGKSFNLDSYGVQRI